MTSGVYIRSKEHRMKLSNTLKGRKYKPMSLLGRKNISISHLGKKPTLGKHWKLSERIKEKMKMAKKDNPRNARYWLGTHKTDEFKEKMRVRMTGDKNWAWKGGISFEPYTVDWTETLKRSIRERDKYICAICGKEPSIYVHHINYDKKNCNSDNLITLCHSCHTKTNWNRDFWIEFFKDYVVKFKEEK